MTILDTALQTAVPQTVVPTTAVPQTSTDAVVLGGRFQLDLRIRRAGLAELWRATDVVLRRPVAVHMLPEWAPVPGLAAAVQAAAQVNDPRLATVFDAC